MRVVACDPVTGALTDAGGELSTNAYRPGKALTALVTARDGLCRFPGCHVAARFCDLDHVIPWPLGPTAASNLVCLCRRHHRTKQRPGWAATLDPGGTLTWTDPTGNIRSTDPLDSLLALTLPADADGPPPLPAPAVSTPRTVIPDGPHTPLEFALEHHLADTWRRPRAPVDHWTPAATYRVDDHDRCLARPATRRRSERTVGAASGPRSYGVRVPTHIDDTTDFVLILSCPDQRGIVATVTAMLFERGANIEESQQFDDVRTDQFFMRIRFSVEAGGPAAAQWEEWFAPVGAAYGMEWSIRDASTPYRTLVMVSRFGHCLNDLLFRWRSGGLNMHIPAIVSNHRDLEPLARSYGVPFHHVPVTADTKPEAEQRLREVVAEHDVELVVLARYMQVLSDGLTQDLSGRIINIHHSFLPSFKGAKPYHQAYERGVKLVGATAHYVTADLDEGPLIEQDVVRVDHRMTPVDLVRAGEECESRVLARALRWHCESRVLLNVDRTVVFS